MDRRDRFFANRFLLIMRKNPRLTAEEAFSQTLDFYGVTCGDAEFLELFYKMRRVIFCVMHYYRCRIIKSILKSGLTLHVFGDCWKRSPFFGEPGLICHADVTMEESMEVWRKSKLSLNVMSWHKGGFTERMANIMLSKAALVTDETSYLNGRFSDGEDLIVFRLKEWETLPELLKGYFNQPEKIQMIAENGYEAMRKEGNERLMQIKSLTIEEYYKAFLKIEEWLQKEEQKLFPKPDHKQEIQNLCDDLTEELSSYPAWMKVHILSFCMKLSGSRLGAVFLAIQSCKASAWTAEGRGFTESCTKRFGQCFLPDGFLISRLQSGIRTSFLCLPRSF